MPGIYDDPASRLNDLLDLQEQRIAQIYRIAIQDLKDAVDLNELVSLLQQGREAEAVDALIYAAEQLGSASNVAFVTSGQSTADFMSGAGVGRIVFDQVNDLAVATMQTMRLDMIREFTDEQRRVTQQALLGGIESGNNPVAMARNFRDSIGLTQRQWAAVQSYQRSLESIGANQRTAIEALTHAVRDKRGDQQIRRAIREAMPLPQEKIDWLVQRKIDMSIKLRAETIARTEAMRAVNAGNEEAYRQAVANGIVQAASLRRKWVTRLDGRERESHALLNGQVRGYGETWQALHGVLRFPGDPAAPAAEVVNCRCVLATRIAQR